MVDSEWATNLFSQTLLPYEALGFFRRKLFCSIVDRFNRSSSSIDHRQYREITRTSGTGLAV